jgi:hypothetical protein
VPRSRLRTGGLSNLVADCAHSGNCPVHPIRSLKSVPDTVFPIARVPSSHSPSRAVNLRQLWMRGYRQGAASSTLSRGKPDLSVNRGESLKHLTIRLALTAGDLYHSMADCLDLVHFDELERQMKVPAVVLNPTFLVVAPCALTRGNLCVFGSPPGVSPASAWIRDECRAHSVSPSFTSSGERTRPIP